jgi:hypothetical protein
MHPPKWKGPTKRWRAGRPPNIEVVSLLNNNFSSTIHALGQGIFADASLVATLLVAWRLAWVR